jgi:hypothetical protein
MHIYCIFFAFVFRGITPLRISKLREYNMQRCNRNKKLYMMEIPEYIENVENVENEFLAEMKKIKMAKHAGRDERYPDDKIDYELLDKITQNSIKMDLLNDLQNSKLSIFDKLLLLEINRDFFIKPDPTFNITDGGLMDNFHTDISI